MCVSTSCTLFSLIDHHGFSKNTVLEGEVALVVPKDISCPTSVLCSLQNNAAFEMIQGLWCIHLEKRTGRRALVIRMAAHAERDHKN
jgi:hypothetical protein